MRQLWINLHLYVAAFFTPILLLIAISGGLYLIGIKGTTDDTDVPLSADATLDLESGSLKEDVDALLRGAGVEHSFEYIKRSGSTITTRPTSRTYYVLEVTDDGVQATRAVPDLQKRLIELHKGHGPLVFKQLQRVTAVGLIFAILAGLWLGLSDSGLWRKAAVATGVGLLVTLGLGFLL